MTKKRKSAFDKISPKCDWNNKEQVIKAVQKDGIDLFCASDELKNDKEVVLAAVQQTGNALRYASDNLKNDKEIAIAAVQQNGMSLSFASLKLRNDKEVVLAAIKRYEFALMYASNEINSLVGNAANPVAALQSLIEKEKLEAKFLNDEKVDQRFKEAL